MELAVNVQPAGPVEILKQGRVISTALPIIGLPDASVIYEQERRLLEGKGGATPVSDFGCQILYDGLGILDDRIKQLGWLNDHLQLKTLRTELLKDWLKTPGAEVECSVSFSLIMNKGPILLSASVPESELDRFVSDPVSIREAVRALVAETVRDRMLVFGGHPAISPLVEHAARDLQATDNVIIYQSKYFENKIPEVAKKFRNLRWTPADPGGRDASLTLMHTEMIHSTPFEAAVFIGGMDGLFEEWTIFTSRYSDAPAFPVASTDAPRNPLDQLEPTQPSERPGGSQTRLDQDFQYRILFRDILG